MANNHVEVFHTTEADAREQVEAFIENGGGWAREDHPHTGIDSDHIHCGCEGDRNTDFVFIYDRGSGYDDSEGLVEHTQQDDNPSGVDWSETYHDSDEDDD